MKKNYKASQTLVNKYRAKKAILEKVLLVVDMVLNGSNETQACRKCGVDLPSYRNFMEGALKFERDQFSFLDKKEPIEFPTWQDSLFAAIMGTSNDKDIYVTDEFKENLMAALKKLSEREQNIVLYRYRDGLTYEEIAPKFGVNRERIRQIEAKAIRRLRHPAYMRLICFGYETINEKNEVAKILKEKKLQYQNEIRQIQQECLRIDNCKKLLEKFCKENGLDLEKRLNNTLEELDLSVRSYNCLRRAGMTTIEDVVDAAIEGKLLNIRNLGTHSAKEIIDALAERGYGQVIRR